MELKPCKIELGGWDCAISERSVPQIPPSSVSTSTQSSPGNSGVSISTDLRPFNPVSRHPRHRRFNQRHVAQPKGLMSYVIARMDPENTCPAP